jgi:hypothetical protein
MQPGLPLLLLLLVVVALDTVLTVCHGKAASFCHDCLCLFFFGLQQ